MDKVHKTIGSQYYTPSSEPFRIYVYFFFITLASIWGSSVTLKMDAVCYSEMSEHMAVTQFTNPEEDIVWWTTAVNVLDVQCL